MTLSEVRVKCIKGHVCVYIFSDATDLRSPAAEGRFNSRVKSAKVKIYHVFDNNPGQITVFCASVEQLFKFIIKTAKVSASTIKKFKEGFHVHIINYSKGMLILITLWWNTSQQEICNSVI